MRARLVCTPALSGYKTGTSARARPGTRVPPPAPSNGRNSRKNVPVDAREWTGVPHSSFPRNEGVPGSSPGVGFLRLPGDAGDAALSQAFGWGYCAVFCLRRLRLHSSTAPGWSRRCGGTTNLGLHVNADGNAHWALGAMGRPPSLDKGGRCTETRPATGKGGG
jgi:hypothetical protein